MAQEHENVLTLALIKASAAGMRLFKNAMGLGYVGKVEKTYRDSFAGEVVTLTKARRVKFGVCNPGGADLIGWQTVKITPDMVGMRVAVFTVIEVKTENYKTMSPDQQNFNKQVIKAGGSAILARRTKDGEGVDFIQLSPEDFNHGR